MFFKTIVFKSIYFKYFHTNLSCLQAKIRMCDSIVHKAIVRHGPDISRVSLQFTHSIGTKSRTFNMNRLASEDVSLVLSRMGTNIVNKLLVKPKSKKVKREEEKPLEIPDVEYNVKLYKSESVLENIKTVSDIESLSLSDADCELTCLEVFVSQGKFHLLKLGSLYYCLDVNPPTVDAMSLPSNIMAGFLLYPNYLDLSYAELHHCVTRWYISEKAFEDHQAAKSSLNNIVWKELPAGFILHTTDDMVGKLIKVSSYLH